MKLNIITILLTRPGNVDKLCLWIVESENPTEFTTNAYYINKNAKFCSPHIPENLCSYDCFSHPPALFFLCTAVVAIFLFRVYLNSKMLTVYRIYILHSSNVAPYLLYVCLPYVSSNVCNPYFYSIDIPIHQVDIAAPDKMYTNTIQHTEQTQNILYAAFTFQLWPIQI